MQFMNTFKGKYSSLICTIKKYISYPLISINYQCPSKYNPADYFIEVLALKVNGKSNLGNINVKYLIKTVN